MLFFAMAHPCVAQTAYQYRDSTGRIVFSDTAPPAGSEIISQPRKSPASTASGNSASPGTESKGKTTPKTAAELEAEYKKRQIEDKKKTAEKEKKQAEESQRVAQCEQLRKAQTTFQSDRRIRQTDDKGEPYYLDDNQRSQEVERVQKQMKEAKC